jgi:RND family efflux transporter MFP subunit
MLRRLLDILPLIAIAHAAASPNTALSQGLPTLVTIEPIVEKELAASQSFVGTVMPLRKAIVGSAVDGRVIEFPLNEGDRVERGGVLAQLLTDTIQLELAAAEAELELRKQELGELENGTRPGELEQAKARMLAADARWKYAKARRDRAEKVGQAITNEQREEMFALEVEGQQAYLDAKAAHELAVEGPRKEQIAQAAAQVAMQQATVDRLKDRLEKHTIISRFPGYVTVEHTEVGQWVQQGDPVAEVVALDEVEIVAHVVEQYVPHIRVHMVVNVDIPALAGEPLPGVVSAIVPQADVQARTFPVKVRVKNQLSDDGPLVKSGMYARVLLPTGKSELATIVSKDALVLGGAQPVVFVIDAPPNAKSGKVSPIPVKLGTADGNMIQVTGNLKPGQHVVVQGNERLQPGQEVMIQRVAAPAAGAPAQNPPLNTQSSTSSPASKTRR